MTTVIGTEGTTPQLLFSTLEWLQGDISMYIVTSDFGKIYCTTNHTHFLHTSQTNPFPLNTPCNTKYQCQEIPTFDLSLSLTIHLLMFKLTGMGRNT